MAPPDWNGMRMIRRLLLPLLLSLLVVPAVAAPREVPVEEDAIGKTTVLAPAEEPTSFVALLSDALGPNDSMRDIAEKLVAGGAAVLLVDTPRFMDGLAKGDEVDCHWAWPD